jgi:hypothetical protein
MDDRIKGIVVLVAVLAILALWRGHVESGSADFSMIEKAHAVLAERLFDPSAAMYKEETVVRTKIGELSTVTVCGQVNGRNRFGGYVGFKRYYYTVVEPHEPLLEVEPNEETTVFDLLHSRLCVK